MLLLPWKNTVPAPVFTVKGAPSDIPSRPAFNNWKSPALPLVTVTLPGTTSPYTPWRRNEMKSGVNIPLKLPPMKIRWPTSIEELPNRLFGLNQVLLKKQMA